MTLEPWTLLNVSRESNRVYLLAEIKRHPENARFFESEEEFKAIRIQGGGGTSFLPIFHYVRDHMQDKNVTSIIILTDGYAPYPEEYERRNIPVLWIVNNNDATPPWGMIARLPRKQNKKF